nr:MAG TPA_asm: hypothetical protein [Caudoviricetes sp.]
MLFLIYFRQPHGGVISNVFFTHVFLNLRMDYETQ